MVTIIFCCVYNCLNQMNHTQFFKLNSLSEDVFNISLRCIEHCKTANKSKLSFEESRCLQSCGYNKNFLRVHMRELLDQIQWAQDYSERL